MEPFTSLYLWPDGKTYSCFVYIHPENARCYRIDSEQASKKYPAVETSRSVRLVAIERFEKGEN